MQVRARVQCRVSEQDTTAYIRVFGRLTARSQHRLTDALWRAVHRRDDVVVDLSQVQYFDSTSLTTLLGIERLAERQLGCQVDLRGIETAAFKITGLAA